MPNFLKTYGEWIRMAVVILFVIGSQYLNTNYVRNDTYNQDKKENVVTMRELASAVSGIRDDTRQTATQVANLRDQLVASHDKQLSDHETRLRHLERKTP